jgi:hypothetical protein
MKKLLAILLLTAAAAFPQTPKVSAVSVPAFSDCPAAFLDELASGCFFPRINVAVEDSNPRVIGFLITVTYRDADGAQRSSTVVTVTRDPDGIFRETFYNLAPYALTVSALELLPGQIEYAH